MPILYSFRRCPYAIRARYTLAVLKVPVYLREVALKSKPAALLALGGRSSVPQLIDADGCRYPESMDIMLWALSKSKEVEPKQLLWPLESRTRLKMQLWIQYNDRFFKYWLDRYKYADRYPEHTEAYYRRKAEGFLQRLERRLSQGAFLFGDFISLADIAIFPFVRQCAAVNQAWFDGSKYEFVRLWLAYFVSSDVFQSVVMIKNTTWQTDDEDIIFPVTQVALQ
ncbi:glutathione S-transferase [Marinomonas sp. IMCC 4694]|nr:glutathione S-transferase [Marinomonas sp. IMCC 4694]